MAINKSANDNWMAATEISARLDWVRPVMVAMRANAIPEPVAQEVMICLLDRLDAYLDGPSS